MITWLTSNLLYVSRPKKVYNDPDDRREDLCLNWNFVRALIQHIFTFSIYQEAPVEIKPYRQKYGALLAIGTLCDKLKQTEPYKSELECMLVQHVFPEFNSPNGHIIAKAAWVISRSVPELLLKREFTLHEISNGDRYKDYLKLGKKLHLDLVVIYEMLNEALEDEYRNEVAILWEVQHKNVVHFIGAYTKQPHMCIIKGASFVKAPIAHSGRQESLRRGAPLVAAASSFRSANALPHWTSPHGLDNSILQTILDP
ncbi:importin beta-like SAD2 [Tanacetum coccineum]